MAINKDNTNHQLTSAEHLNWPELVSKTVDDVSRIVRTEKARSRRWPGLAIQASGRQTRHKARKKPLPAEPCA
jgi:hypothetical protein